MCDAEAIADDREAGPRALALLSLHRCAAERGRLEETSNVARGDTAEERRQRVVELRLIGGVAIERKAAVLAGRQDRPRSGRVVALGCRLERREDERQRSDEGRDERGGGPVHARQRTSRCLTPARAERRRNHAGFRAAGVGRRCGLQSRVVEALLAFGAALVSLRLSADLLRRYRDRRAPELAAWAVALAAYAVAAGALAWGTAAGWSDAVFRVYYLGGALLTAAFLGVGSLLLAGRRRVGPAAFVYAGLAVGIALAMPLRGEIAGTAIPDAQDVLDLWPGRVVAIAGNSLGTLAVVVVALTTFRARPVGNALILAGVGVAAIGSGLGGLGVGALAPAIALRRSSSTWASSRLRGLGSSSVSRSRLRRRLRRSRSTTATRTRTTTSTIRPSTIAPATHRAPLEPRGEQPQPLNRVEHHQREHRVLRTKRRAPGRRRSRPRGRARCEPGNVPDTSAATWTYQTSPARRWRGSARSRPCRTDPNPCRTDPRRA